MSDERVNDEVTPGGGNRSGAMDGSPVSSPSSVSERPIIFSDQLIRAILRDEKTETRRVITPQPKQCRPTRNVDTAGTAKFTGEAGETSESVMKNRFRVQLPLKVRKAIIQIRHRLVVLRIELLYFVRMTFFSFKRLALRFKKFRLDCKVFALYLKCLFLYRKYHVTDPPIRNRLVKLCYEVHKVFYKRHGGWGIKEAACESALANGLAENAPIHPPNSAEEENDECKVRS